MTDRVDRGAVEDIILTLNIIMIKDQVYDVELSAAAKALRALLAERDRLREALEWVEHNGGFAHPANTVAIARAALKGDQT